MDCRVKPGNDVDRSIIVRTGISASDELPFIPAPRFDRRWIAALDKELGLYMPPGPAGSW